MTAAGECTAEEAQTISVDSATTEEEKKPKQQASPSSSRPRASSSPKTRSQMRSLSNSHCAKASDKRPSKSVIQRRQTIKRMKDREPTSPEQPKSRSSSRSTSRKALMGKQSSPSPAAKRSPELTPMSQRGRTSMLQTRPMRRWKGQYEFKVKEDVAAIFLS